MQVFSNLILPESLIHLWILRAYKRVLLGMPDNTGFLCLCMAEEVWKNLWCSLRILRYFF